MLNFKNDMIKLHKITRIMYNIKIHLYQQKKIGEKESIKIIDTRPVGITLIQFR